MSFLELLLRRKESISVTGAKLALYNILALLCWNDPCLLLDYGQHGKECKYLPLGVCLLYHSS